MMVGKKVELYKKKGKLWFEKEKYINAFFDDGEKIEDVSLFFQDLILKLYRQHRGLRFKKSKKNIFR